MVYDTRVDAYKLASSLSQTMLDETLRGNETQIETIGILTKVVDGTTYTLRFSDRSKYVGDDYYEGRAQFPDIKRTVGELVSPTIQFSEMSVELNNVDGFYNEYLTTGANYFNFIGARLEIKVGVYDKIATFFTMFDGYVPDEDGYSIDREKITIRARDKAEKLNRATGLPVINSTDFPDAPDESLGKIIPMVLGRWSVGYTIDPDINSRGAISSRWSDFQYNVITDAPKNFYGGIVGYHVGGGFFVFSIGTYTPSTIQNCHIKRGKDLISVNFVPTPQDAAGYWVVQVLSINVVGDYEIPYTYTAGDLAAISVDVPYSPNEYSNPVRLAKEILITLGGLSLINDFDNTSWSDLELKSSPAKSAIANIPARIWIGKEDDKILELVLGLLEQVRIEMYWNNDQKVALKSLHVEDFVGQYIANIEQAVIAENSFKIVSDQRNFFNIAAANYGWTPLLDKTQLQTQKRKNQNSIDKSGKQVIKIIDIPNLYVEGDVLNQLDEFIRFYSCGQQYVECQIAWTQLLRDLNEIIKLTYDVGSIDFLIIPMKIRDITFMPATGCLMFKMLSFSNFPYTGNPLSNESRMLSSQNETIEDF